MKTLNLTIDGQKVEATAGKTVLEAALDAGIYIPNLCHSPDLKPVGVCRLCLVEITGRGLLPACLTPAQEGMVVKTETPEIRDIRRTTAELLILNHHTDCLSCTRNTKCRLQQVANYLGIDKKRLGRLRPLERNLPIDSSNPFFDRDMNRCLLCGICIRTCNTINGAGAIDFAFRGYNTTISTLQNKPLLESNCESCGECLVRCPVGALTPKTTQVPAREVKTVCPYCGCGCGIYLGVRGDRVVSSRGDNECPANRGKLCVKGRFGFEFINHPDRLTSPLIKKDGRLVKTSWDEAIDLVATKLARYKGDQFAAIASARCTIEDNYVFQKFVRAVMGTNNIEHCARL